MQNTFSAPLYIVVFCLSGSTIFSTLFHKSRIFEEKRIDNKTFCFNLLYNYFSETFLTLRRIQQDIIINVHLSTRKIHVIIVRFLMKLNILSKFSKNTKLTKFAKIRPVVPIRRGERADGRKSMIKTTVTFRNSIGRA
jgi:hypothetical protein